MGIFCISCGVSGQVIANHDKCAVLPLIQQSTYNPVEMTQDGKSFSFYGIANSNCGPDAHWAPFGAFVTGEYADYGGINPDDTVTNRRAMADFFVRLVKDAPVVKQGQNSSHDVPFDIATFIQSNAPVLAERISALPPFRQVALDGLVFEELVAVWEYVWTATQRHRLFCRASGVIRPIQFAAFHQQAVNHLVEIASAQSRMDYSYELSAFLQRQLDELAADTAETPEGCDTSAENAFLRLRLCERLNLNVQGATAMLYPFLRHHHALLKRHLDEGIPFEDYVESMRPSMEGIYVYKAMEYLNLELSPIQYAGQDYSNRQGQARAQFIAAVAEDIAKEISKRNDW